MLTRESFIIHSQLALAGYGFRKAMMVKTTDTKGERERDRERGKEGAGIFKRKKEKRKQR